MKQWRRGGKDKWYANINDTYYRCELGKPEMSLKTPSSSRWIPSYQDKGEWRSLSYYGKRSLAEALNCCEEHAKKAAWNP